jgi:hypothetical protein
MSLEIIDLPAGEKITEPGFYRLPLTRHHTQPCEGVSVTSGELRRMHLFGPSKVWTFHDLNPHRFEDDETDALRTGTAMAAYIEGGMEEVNRQFIVLPDDRPRRPTKDQLTALKEDRASATAKRSIAFWGAIDNDPRPILTETELELICAMGAALVKDSAAQAVLGGEPEISMAWQDATTGIWCLARPDNLHFDGTMSDYKKVNTQGRPFTQFMCDARVERYGYDMQLAFGCTGFEQLTGEWPGEAGLIFQEDAPPYDVILLPVLEEDLRIGQFRNRQALDQFKECLDAGSWPGPGENIRPYARSEKSRERALEEMGKAGVAP